MTRTVLAFVALGAASLASLAHAHGLDANRVEIVLQGDTVDVVATPPASFVASADRDGDGLLSRAEVSAARSTIQGVLLSALHVTDPDGRAAVVERADVSVPRSADGHRGGEFLRVTARLRFAAAPTSLRVRCDFVREHPVTVFATHARALHDGRVGLHGTPELAVLRDARATATVLRGGAR